MKLIQKRLIYTFLAICIITGGLFINQKYQEAKSAPLSSARNYVSAPNRSGLVGHWNMDTSDMSVSGATMYDKSGNNNNGTVTGTTTSTGRISQARSFNGTSDYIDAGAGSSLNSPNNVTVSFWIKWPTFGTSAWHGILAKRDDVAYLTNYGFNFSPTADQFQWYYNSSGNGSGYQGLMTTLSTNFSTNIWTHITGVFQKNGANTTAILYKNGVQINSGTLTGNVVASAANLTFGRSKDFSNFEYANIVLDDVRIYNYALSAQDVANLYSATARKYTAAAATRTGLVGHWNMDTSDMSVSGATMYDKSGNGNNGTITGTTTSTGRIGQARSFNGTSDYISLGSPSVVNFGAGNFSFSAWIKFSTVTPPAAGHAYMILSKDSVTARQFSFSKVPDKTMLFGYFKDNINLVYFGSNRTIDDLSWHHIVGQRNGNSFDIYIDGVSAGSGTTAGTHGTMQATATQLDIGRREYAGNLDYFPGLIDDVRIYNRALSAQEVMDLYNSSAKNNMQ